MDVFVGNLLKSPPFEDKSGSFSRSQPWET